MPKLKHLIFYCIIFAIGFGLVEGVSRIFSVPGSYEYIERCGINQGLTPRKPRDEFRIFLFGESTMHGSHLHPQSTIQKWIDMYLENVLEPEDAERVRVINFARLGAASDFIAEGFVDMVGFKPDVAAFYSAHNDYIIRGVREGLVQSAPFGERVEDGFKNFCKRFAFFSGVKRAALKVKLERRRKRQPPPDGRTIKEEWYDEPKGNIHYTASKDLLTPHSDLFRQVETQWQQNIERILRKGQSRKIPVVFFNAVSRMKDYAPFESRNSPDLSADQLSEWQRIFKAAEDLFAREDYVRARSMYEQALKIDDHYALIHFRLGQLAEMDRQYDVAYNYYEQANDLNYYPIRAPSVINTFYQQLAAAAREGVFVLDSDRSFREQSTNGLVDGELVFDQIHPTVRGQALMALQLIQLIYEQELFVPKERWHWDRLKSFDELAQQIEITDDHQFFIYVYSARFVSDYYGHAEQFLKKALAIKPDSLAARTRLAWTYWRMGKKDEAIKMYRALSRQYPDQAEEFFKRQPEIAQYYSGQHPKDNLTRGPKEGIIRP